MEQFLTFIFLFVGLILLFNLILYVIWRIKSNRNMVKVMLWNGNKMVYGYIQQMDLMKYSRGDKIDHFVFHTFGKSMVLPGEILDMTCGERLS